MTKIGLILLFNVLGVLLPTFAQAKQEVNCQSILQGYIFVHTKEDEAAVDKIRSVYGKLKAVKSKRDRLATLLPEYKEDMLELDRAIEEITPEIAMILTELKRIYALGRVDSFNVRTSHVGSDIYFRYNPGLAEFDIPKFLEALRAKLQLWATTSPTYAQSLFAADLVTNILERVMDLRGVVRLSHDQTQTLSEQELRDYFSRIPQTQRNEVLNFIYSLTFRMQKDNTVAHAMPGAITDLAIQSLEIPEEKKIDDDLNWRNKILPIPVTKLGLLPPNVFLEVVWQNLQLIQTMPAPVLSDADGETSGPWSSLRHDVVHQYLTASDREKAAYRTLLRYKTSVQKDQPTWMPLLKLLLLYQRHEDSDRISELPQDLDKYLPDVKPTAGTISFSERLNVLHLLDAPGMHELYTAQWTAFIRYLKTLRN